MWRSEMIYIGTQEKMITSRVYIHYDYATEKRKRSILYGASRRRQSGCRILVHIAQIISLRIIL
jgi:hypothetical protein